jgi:hypothetical protein
MITLDKGGGLRCHGAFCGGSESMLDSPRFEQACSHGGRFTAAIFLLT